jgi:hypothetical protein
MQRSNDPGRRGQFERSHPGEGDERLYDRVRTPWDDEARRIIRSEMERRGVTYRQLVQLMRESGEVVSVPNLTERTLTSRITRGTFTFSFALEILRAMRATELDIRPISKPRIGPELSKAKIESD